MALFFAVGMVLAVLVQASHTHYPPSDPTMERAANGGPFYGGWMQWDSGWYVQIAAHGYDQKAVADFKAGQESSVAFFPGYPLVVRQVARVTSENYFLAADLTTIASGFAVFLLFWSWCGRRLSPSARRMSLLVLALYPYSWYLYGSGYGDALFIAFAIGAFLLLELDRPVLAGLAGAAASATRLVGVGTIIGLVVLVIERRHALVRTDAETSRRLWSGWRLDRTRLRARDGGVLLSLAGIGSYCVFTWIRFGDPIAFNTVQAAPGWRQGLGFKSLIKTSFFSHVLRGNAYGYRLLAQALLCLLFIVAIPYVAKRIGAAYAVYAAVVIGIPLIGDSTMQGFGRYLLSTFPMFAVGGVLLADRVRLRWAVLVSSGSALLYFASLFGRGVYLS